MASIHDLRLADFLALEKTGKAEPSEQDMGALKLAYANQWRSDTLSMIAGRDGRYALAADWLSTALLLVRKSRGGARAPASGDAWELAGVFSENLFYLARPHRGAMLSVDLQLFAFDVRGGRVGCLPPYTPVSLVARKSAYRIAVRRAIAAGHRLSDAVMEDYRELVREKKERDETGRTKTRDVTQALSSIRS